MLRSAVIGLVVLLAACDVGEIPGAGGDGGGGGGGDGGGGSDCAPIAATIPVGHHNPGMGCRTAGGCHNAQLGLGAAAPEYSVGGTLFKDTAGTMPYAGVTVTVTVNGTTKTAVTADNGNFWFVPALLPGPTATMTGTTKASACPTTLSMSGLLVGGGGDCNNCHRPGGQTLPMYVAP